MQQSIPAPTGFHLVRSPWFKRSLIQILKLWVFPVSEFFIANSPIVSFLVHYKSTSSINYLLVYYFGVSCIYLYHRVELWPMGLMMYQLFCKCWKYFSCWVSSVHMKFRHSFVLLWCILNKEKNSPYHVGFNICCVVLKILLEVFICIAADSNRRN